MKLQYDLRVSNPHCVVVKGVAVYVGLVLVIAASHNTESALYTRVCLRKVSFFNLCVPLYNGVLPGEDQTSIKRLVIINQCCQLMTITSKHQIAFYYFLHRKLNNVRTIRINRWSQKAQLIL